MQPPACSHWSLGKGCSRNMHACRSRSGLYGCHGLSCCLHEQRTYGETGVPPCMTHGWDALETDRQASEAGGRAAVRSGALMCWQHRSQMAGMRADSF